MMGCKRTSIKIGKLLLAAVSPAGFRFIANTVEIMEQTDWSNKAKRDLAIDLAKAEARTAGREIREGAIRAAVEISVAALKQGAEEVRSLGSLEASEVEGVEMVEV